MRRITHILSGLVLLVASIAAGQSPSIVGPSTAAVDQEIRLLVEGLKTPPLDGGLIPLLEWGRKIPVVVDAPDGAKATATSAMELGFGAQPILFRIYFSGSKPGVYVLGLADTNQGTLTLRRVTVGPVVPIPDPTPTPPPGPPMPAAGKRIALLVREASDVTPKMNLTELALRDGPAAEYLKSEGHSLLILSDDRGLPSSASKATKDAWEKVKHQKLPALAIIDAEGQSGELFVGSIDPDATPETILDIIKEHGG